MLRKSVIKLIDKNIADSDKVFDHKMFIWTKYVLFTWEWWLGVFLTIVPWVIWLIIRKKESTHRLLYVGFFVMIISAILDITGAQIGLWHYRYEVVPFIPSYFPWDFTLMPVLTLLFIQIKSRINPMVKAVAFALFTSFAAEPLFEWLQVYERTNWEYFYSVPIQICIYTASHYLSRTTKGFSILHD